MKKLNKYSFIFFLIILFSQCTKKNASKESELRSNNLDSINEITLSIDSSIFFIDSTYKLVWTSPYAAEELIIQYSKNDKKSWTDWYNIKCNNNLNGSVLLMPGWKQYNLWFLSYYKIKNFFTSRLSFKKFTGDPLFIRIIDKTKPQSSISNIREVNIVGPEWWTVLMIASYVFVCIVIAYKSQWNENPRKDLSGIFNIVCFGCLFAKITFLLPFWMYLFFAFIIWHRYKIVSNNEYKKYWLEKIYRYTCTGTFVLFIAIAVFGLVMRIKNLIF